MKLKKVLAGMLSAAVALSSAGASLPVSADSTLPESPYESSDNVSVGTIFFDPGDWNSESIYFYIWDDSDDALRFASQDGWGPDNNWGSRKLAGVKNDMGIFESYPIELADNRNYYVIFYDPYTGNQTFDCVLNKSAFGDVARRTGEILENPADSTLTAESAEFYSSHLTSRLCLTSSGKVQGRSVAPLVDRPLEVAKFIFAYQGTYDIVSGNDVVTVQSVSNGIKAFETTPEDVWKAYTGLKDNDYYAPNYTDAREAEAKAIIFNNQGYADSTDVSGDWENNGEYSSETLFDYYSTTDGTIITGYKGTESHVKIPPYINGNPVTVISNFSEYNSSENGTANVRRVTIPDTVTAIEEMAFYNCTSLSEIDFPDSLEKIGQDAFDGTPWLENYSGDFVIPVNGLLVKYKGQDENVNIPEGISVICDGAFFLDDHVKSVVIPSSVESIGSFALSCSGLEDVTIPNTVENIDGYAFYGTPWLENYPTDFVIVGNKILIAYIGTEQNVVIPSTVRTVASNIFLQKRVSQNNILSVQIPNSAFNVNKYAFSQLESLQRVIIPESVTNIGDNMLYGSKNAVIYCIAGSVAEQYAIDNGIPYQNVGNTEELPEIYTDTPSYSDTDSQTDTYPVTDTDTYSGTQTDTDTYADIYTDTDTQIGTDTDTYIDTYTDTDTDSGYDADTHTDTDTYTDTGAYSDTDTEFVKDPNKKYGKIKFDSGDWNSTRICFYIWDKTGDKTTYATKNGWGEDNPWGSKKTLGEKLPDGLFESYEFGITPGHETYVIFYDPDSGNQTYDCVLTEEAFGDVAVRTGEILENPVDSEKTAEAVKFAQSGLTAPLSITSTGRIQGETTLASINGAKEIALFVFKYQGTTDKVTGKEVVTVETVSKAVEAFDVNVDDIWNEYQALKTKEEYLDNYTQQREAEAKNIIFSAAKVDRPSGDVDGDGSLSSHDALLILRGSSGMAKLTDDQILFADVDGDGEVTSSDALSVLRQSTL